MKLPIFFLLILMVAFASCKKCEDGKKIAFWNNCPPNPVVEKAKLLKKAWKVSSVRQTGYTMPIYQDPLPNGDSNLEDYRQYRLTFTSDTDYLLSDRNGSTSTGKWRLTNGGTQLVLGVGTNAERTYDIIELTATLLEIRFNEESTKTGNRELTIKFIPV